MHQLSFQFQQNENSFRSRIEQLSGKNVTIVITDNTTSMLSMKAHGKSISMRIHRMFLSAGSEVMEELALFMKNGRVETPCIREFIKENRHLLKKNKARKVNIKTEGSRYNLLEIFHSVNREYFNGQVSASITWGSKGPGRAAARRTLGSYCAENNMIRINPMLDNRGVPKYFVEIIVYHEMLHAQIGIKVHQSRRSIHPKEFKKREKMFKQYDRAIEWEKKRW